MKAWLKEVLGPPKQELTTQRLHQLANELTRASETSHSKSESVVESVRQIAELMIWGDRHNPSFFDVFLERDILGSILVLLKGQNTRKAVKIQIIQTLSMMISNTQNETSVYFILSNNRINELIQHDFDFTDIDYISYYISFVKALSLKLNNDTVQFFFNNPKQQFVLYTEAVRHFKHPESMVRIAVRTLTLKVFSVEDERMRAFVLTHATNEYLVAVIDNCIDVVQNLGIECANSTMTQNSHAKLECRIEELLDMLHYLCDVIASPWPELQEATRTIISEKFVRPLLQATVPGLGDMLSTDDSNVSIHLSADLVYFVLLQMIRAIDDKGVLLSCTLALLSFEAQQQGPAATNVYREELLGHLNHKDEELVLPALCLLQVVVSHKNMSHNLLASVNLLPRRFHNEQSQLALLTEGFDSPPASQSQDCWQPSSAQKLLAAVRDRAASDSPPSRPLKQSPAKLKEKERKNAAKAERIAAEKRLMAGESPSPVEKAPEEADLAGANPEEEQETPSAEEASPAEEPDPPANEDAEEEEKKRKLKMTRMENERKLMTEGPGKSREVGAEAMSKAERMEAERAIMRTGALPQPRGALKFEDELEPEPEPERHFSAAELAGMTKEERMAAERQLMQFGKVSHTDGMAEVTLPMDDLPEGLLASPHSPQSSESGKIEEYPGVVVEKLLHLLCRYPTCRTVTIQVAASLVLNLVQTQTPCLHPLLHPKHWNKAQQCYSLARSFLRNRVYGTMANVLLDMFESEVKAAEAEILVDHSRQNMMMIQMGRGGFLLLPASSTSSSSLDLSMRLPRNELEITRKAIQVFLLIRRLIHELQGQVDTALPLKREINSFEVDSPIDLSDQDVIACGVKTTSQMRPVSRYIVINKAFLVIVDPDPDPKKMSWAFVRVVHPLQYVEAKATRADPRILQVAMRKNQKQEVMHLVFDDQRRCVSARQHFERGREFVQKSMMEQINSLLWPEDMPRAATSESAQNTTAAKSK